MRVADRAGLPPGLDAIRTLHELIRWGLAQSPPRVIEDVIVQDEYTHDVLLPWHDTQYLAFDTT